MMGTLEGQQGWHEPGLGELFGSHLTWLDEPPGLEYSSQGDWLRYKENWLRRIRPLILGGGNARVAWRSRRAKQGSDYLVIREPNGSTGAPWLLAAVPESRMIFLVRDPRDVVASQLDAYQKGSWAYMNYPIGTSFSENELASTKPNAFVEKVANRYLRDIGCVKRAYDRHSGPKVLVRYEDLSADTLGTMRRMYSALGIEVDEEELDRAVEEHSWENIPKDEKGKGKRWRRATPGGWRDDLSPEQATIVEGITAPLLRELYPE